MKRFETINGQEIVYIQGKDLRFSDSQSRTPKNLKRIIKFEHLDFSEIFNRIKKEQEEYNDWIKEVGW